MPVRRTSAPLLLLACAGLALAATPTASADAVPLPPWILVPDPADTDPPVELPDGLEQLMRQFGPLVEGPDPARIVDADYTVTLECRVNEAGQTECRGVVCRGSGGEGEYPVAVGDDEYSVGVDTTPNPDGSYGPYETVRVSLGGNCGCTAWVQVLWPA